MADWKIQCTQLLLVIVVVVVMGDGSAGFMLVWMGKQKKFVCFICYLVS